MKPVNFQALALAAVFILGAAACGSLAEDTDKPGTLSTVRGSVTNPEELAVGDGFRVAVVWATTSQELGDGSYGYDRRTSQDVPVTPKFPAQFQLELNELPNSLQPFEQIFGTTGNVKLRGVSGLVVAYDDVNRNGKLDLVTASSPGFVDRVLGKTDSPLFYLEGTMPSDLSLLAVAGDAEGQLPKLGFNLLSFHDSDCEDDDNDCNLGVSWAAVSKPISISLSGNQDLANMMCAELPSSIKSYRGSEHAPGEYPTTFPSRSDPNLQCSADGKSFQYTTERNETPTGICQASVTHQDSNTYFLAPGSAAPNGWPCTIP